MVFGPIELNYGMYMQNPISDGIMPVFSSHFFYDSKTAQTPYIPTYSQFPSLWMLNKSAQTPYNSYSFYPGLSLSQKVSIEENNSNLVNIFKRAFEISSVNAPTATKTDNEEDSKVEQPKKNSKKEQKNTGNSSKVPLSTAIEKGLKFTSEKHKQRWSQMDSTMQNELMKLVEYANSKGITIYINSSIRSEAEQQQLVKSGAPAAKKGSKHLTGRAVDISVSGDRSKNLAILGEYWRDNLHHRWGQDFKHPRPEPWHFDIG